MNQHQQPDHPSQDLHTTIEYLKNELGALKKLIANPTPISADAYPRLMTQPTVPELSLPLSQIKDIYQHYPQILEPFAYRVSLDNRQLIRNQERNEIPLSFEANKSGHFWVITLPNQGHFLFPRPTDFKQFNRLDCLDQIFDRINNSSNSQDTFDLNQPATLKALRLQQSWQLEKKGELIYGQSPNHYQWQQELKKIREEYEKIKQLNHGGNSSFDTNPMAQYWQLALVEKIEQTGQLITQIITELDGVSSLDNRLDHILQQFESTGSLVLSNPPPLQPPSQKLESYSFTSARVDNLGQITSYEATGRKYTELALQLPPGAVPLEMASIPGDSFMMGQRDNGLTGEGRENEKPSHLVTVPSFFVGRYPITQAQYEAVMGINPNRRMATIWNGSQWIIDHPIPVQFDGMNKPAIAISFEDTQEFIRKLNQITGKQYRLPSEAEWEFVARAGTTTDYCYGDIITHQLVNFDGTTSPHQPSRAACPNGTLDVNQLYPNPWGLYHIHGNVWEWVEDCWHKNYSGAPTDGSAWIRDGVSEQRVVRGGSWANRYDRARSSYRSLDSSISHFNSNGFRIALSNLWSSTPIIQAGNSSPSIPMPVGNVSPTPKQTSSKQSTSSVSLDPYECITAQVDDRGNVTTYSVKPPGGKYVEQGLKLPSGALPLEMVVIPAGTFTMGSPDNEAKRKSHEGPQRQVRVKQFLMGRYEVTQAQYEGVMGTNPTTGRSFVWNGKEWEIGQIPSKFLGENKPVIGVSWDDAQEFIRRLNEKIGKRYRLPTEAEWEYGARAGTTTPFSYGATITPEVANYDGNYPYGNAPKGEFRKKTMDVNTLYPNPWGLYHIHGNVWEWVEDYYHDNYEGAPTDGSAWLTGGDQSRRLLRGGSWSHNSNYCRSAYRLRNNPDLRLNIFGFRVVMSFP